MCVSPFPCNLSELRQHAERGEDIAQDAFARHHYHGDGVPLDYAEAARWFRLAARQDYAPAQFHLGVLYHHGDGVRRTYRAALAWYRRAASHRVLPTGWSFNRDSVTAAQNNIGVLYDFGHGVPLDLQQAVHQDGVPLDHAEAARWYQRAAARGNPTAQFNLAHMYACGDGVCQNRNTAYWWYWRAAKQGHARAIRTLEQLPPRRPPGRRRRAAGKENTPHAE